MPDSLPATKPSLSFAKLVATPTELAWSQAYNAGNLFACLALTTDAPDESTSLQAVGKDIFNALQSEFFSLEEKNADTIKEAVKISTAKLPESVQVSLVLANFKDDLLTVFIAGNGKVVMKRDTKIGTLLEKHTAYDGTITFASGYLQNADTIVLQTGQFAQGLSHEAVTGALDLELPNDVVESLSPQMHEQDNGAQAAIVIRYSGTSHPRVQEDTEAVAESQNEETQTIATVTHDTQQMQDEPTLADEIENEQLQEDSPKRSFQMKVPSFPSMHLTHKRKLFLSVALVITILLGASIFFTMKKQDDEKRQAVFAEIYPVAQQYYEEGQGLESLNKERSRESYLKAESKLKEGETKIAKGTEEYKQIEELMGKVAAAMQGAPATQTSDAKESTAPENSLLAIAQDNASGLGFGQDSAAVYMITADKVTSFAKGSGAKKDVLENENGWTTPKSVVPYQTNVYILDQKNGVLKYVATNDGFTKSSYFTGTAPNLSKATGMAIDGSIWIVGSDGKILKYTRGQQDTFGLSGLDKPFSKPSKILTDASMESIYVMDNGNSRIVKLDKKGAFQKEYAASVIKNAQDFDINQKDNKILILSGNKIWELPL